MLVLAAVACSRQTVPSSGVVVRDARAFEAPAGRTAAAYATIVNGTDSAEVLDSVASPSAGAVTAHTSHEVNGLVVMEALERPSIASHDSLIFTVGGAHLMLEDLIRALVAGDSVPLTLWFHRAGRIEVTAKVSAYGS